MRGKARKSAESGEQPGITPAYAGKSFCLFLLILHNRDHPRVCGEKSTAIGKVRSKRGSPPRMRGKAHALKKRTLPVGITPAYAGKRFVLTVQQGWKQDHPRVCGEKSAFRLAVRSATGSPPRMRGKVAHLSEVSVDEGITPAYAGKSPRSSLLPLSRWDHPRVCGEKTQNPTQNAILMGSPPRMRGKDHSSRANTNSAGSPPRMRGKGITATVQSSITGITPAYAGKSYGKL